MDATRQRTLAVWAVFVIPFFVIIGWLAVHGRLRPTVVGPYWFPAVVLTLIGAIPPPWQVVE